MTQALYAPGYWFGGVAAIYDSGTTSELTTPTNLSTTVVGSTQIDLNWTASTGGSGSITYNVQRCSGSGCSNFVQVGTSLSAAFSDTGLSASTSYSYRVQANDSGGHLSGWSNTASATTSSSGGGACAASATNAFSYTYNSNGQLQSISTTAGCTAQYAYDENGNLLSVQVTP